jgi:pimeloyl-ACP methyl ester carboxylesterase
MSKLSEKIWYKLLKRPITLKDTIDEGKGQPVILLHGIGKTGQVWKHVVEGLRYFPCRIVAYDILGFGVSPKPDWIEYNVDDHASAVINSLDRLGAKKPYILVGHSMGCLIAVRVAKLRPDLVEHLVLYEMPLYEGLPKKRIYRIRLEMYERFYNWVVNYQPSFSSAKLNRSQRIAQRVVGFQVDKETWQPFIKSLKNTIMNQKTVDENIKTLKMPMDVIYGTFDMMVIKGNPTFTVGSESENIKFHKVRARHIISPKASRLIVQRIVAALKD